MIVTKDPETGELRPATPAEREKLLGRQPLVAPEHKVVTLPDGSKMVELGEGGHELRRGDEERRRNGLPKLRPRRPNRCESRGKSAILRGSPAGAEDGPLRRGREGPPPGALVLVLAAAALPLAAADIQIVVTDGTGVGFNDPTPRHPWWQHRDDARRPAPHRLPGSRAHLGSALPSNVPIKISSSFSTLTALPRPPSSARLERLPSGRTFRTRPSREPGTTRPRRTSSRLATGHESERDHCPIQQRARKDRLPDGNVLLPRPRQHHGSNVNLLTVLLHEFRPRARVPVGGELERNLRWLRREQVSRHFRPVPLRRDGREDLGPDGADSDRAASAINTGKLVWNGPNATLYAKAYNALPRLVVTAPAGVAGTYTVATASFGVSLSSPGITAAWRRQLPSTPARP